MTSKKLSVLLLLFVLASTSSCVKYKDIVYLQEESGGTYDNYLTHTYRIRTFDNVSIMLTSLEQSTVTDFNISEGRMMPMNGPGMADALGNPNLFMSGYIVNEEGYINLPLVGSIKVSGLTIDEVKVVVDDRLKEYLKFPSVSVKLMNFKITVLGEVRQPGVKYVYENRITLLEALSISGDITEFANIKRVKLIRRTEDGQKTVYMDLSRPDLIASEYFFLLPDDVIYVQPTQAKISNINSRTTSIALSTISVILVVINLILR